MIEPLVAVMAHPSRRGRVEALCGRLGPCSPVVHYDERGDGPWAVARRCWLSASDRHSHVLILQDDALVSLDFYVGASRVLRHRPSGFIAFYANCREIDEARTKGVSWARIRRAWGVAQCLPVRDAQRLVAWADAQRPGQPEYDRHVDSHGVPGDDWFLERFLLIHKIPIWATVPSLVEHGCPKDSLVGHRQTRPDQRVARWFIGEERSALSVDWRVG